MRNHYTDSQLIYKNALSPVVQISLNLEAFRQNGTKIKKKKKKK